MPFEVPSGWVWCKFGDYLDVRDGTHDSPKYVESGIPFVTSKNLKNGKIDFSNVLYISRLDHEKFTQRSNVEDNDILFAMIGSIGNPVLIKKDREFSIKNVALFKAIDRKNTFMQYVLFFLIYVQDILKEDAKGGMQPFIPLSYFRKELYIPFPPLAEQQRIVAEIERWFGVIDALDSNEGDLLKSIEQTKKKVLDLAIRGKLVPQDPNDEPAGELLKKLGVSSDNRPYENVPFEVPNGWVWTRLDSLCYIKGGKRIPKGMAFSEKPTKHIYIRVTNMKNHTIIDNEIKYIDEDVFQCIKNYTISASDLYLTIAGTIGDVGEVPQKYNGMNLTENAAKLTCINTNKTFLKFALLSSHVQDHFSNKFHQVAQPKLSIETASSALIPLPPLSEQQRIVAKIEELYKQLDAIATSLQA